MYLYIVSALISLFITASLILTALYLKRLYYKALDNTHEFIKMVIYNEGNANDNTANDD